MYTYAHIQVCLVICVCKLRRLVPRPVTTFFGYTKESHRAWYLSHVLNLHVHVRHYPIQKTAALISLRFTGDFVSAVSLWHFKRKSYKKCRFATFTRCLTIATVLAHTHNYLSTTSLLFGLVHVTLDTRPCDFPSCNRKSPGPGNEAIYKLSLVPSLQKPD